MSDAHGADHGGGHDAHADHAHESGHGHGELPALHGVFEHVFEDVAPPVLETLTMAESLEGAVEVTAKEVPLTVASTLWKGFSGMFKKTFGL